MTQPHYIDRDDLLERLRALDFAGHYDEARFQFIADDILALTEAPTEADTSLQKVQTTPPDREAVAWRWRWPDTNNWHYADYNLHPEAEEVQALAVIPIEGLGSSAEGADTHRAEDRAVLTLKEAAPG